MKRIRIIATLVLVLVAFCLPEKLAKAVDEIGTRPPEISPPTIALVESSTREPLAPVDAIEVAPEPVAAPAAVNTVSGSPNELMAAAGIPEGDRDGMDWIISHEGGWEGTTRWNTGGSGAYGLCQSLPGNKMADAGADWATNPITQLKWCHGYAMSYGSVAQAVTFKKCMGYCYSPRTNNYQNKVETWF